MDLLHGNVKKNYFKYLSASFGSALVLAIYSIVDTAMVGQYEGANGVAALATIAPIWNIIYSLGLLFGIGGAVLMSKARGEGNHKKGNQIFSIAFIGVTVIAIGIGIIIYFFDYNLLRLFGADETLMPLAQKYLECIKFTVPLFVFGQFLAAFLRNDNAPLKATMAVIAGGVFNIFGDYFFVFTCDMGIWGAGLATALGQLLSVIILCSHFFTKKCSLRFVKPIEFLKYTKQVITVGFSTFFIDIALGILSMMFNNQIMRYLGSNALAVYGVIINVNILIQSCAYGIGQASQSIISVNYGAKKVKRIMEAFRWSMVTVVILSVLWTGITMGLPTIFVRIFMTPTKEVLEIAPNIMRVYFISFLMLPFNIYSTYYFQAIMKPKASFALSVLRGLVISGLFIYLLPVFFGPNSLWLAMPMTELIIMLGGLLLMKVYNRKIKLEC